MRFYTGQGDNGKTALFDSGGRTPKTNLVFEALGALDELNSYLGICKTLANEEKIKDVLKNAQENLFIIQAELGGAKMALTENKIKELEKIIDEFGSFVGQITKFTIPGGDSLSVHLDFARALARSVERRAAALKNQISPTALAYLNRLSSLLFVLARYVNKKARVTENHPKYR